MSQHLESFRFILIYLLNLFFVQFFPSFSIGLLVFPSPFCVVQVRCSLSAAMRYAIDAHNAVESGGRGLLCELATSSPMAHMPAVKELAAVGGTWEWRFPNSWGYPIKVSSIVDWDLPIQPFSYWGSLEICGNPYLS